ncbi:NAD(P)H-dependent flavin oxidoreductase [Vulgatibacter sp.]|uniref:NAD(P)H-dependent flavin oxidoreductase n=1 Tax=Vulgatibacter sp. TaxID=1971226 RepID=UPI0035628642
MIETALTHLLGLRLPVLVGPMTAVSDEHLLVAAAEAGVIAGVPPHNYPGTDAFGAALGRIRKATQGPFAVNLVVNRVNPLRRRQLEVALEHHTPLFVTSLGDPTEVIEQAHRRGAKVFCDVTTAAHAERVARAGADGLVAVVAGAGGHTGHLSPLAFVPWLVDRYDLPVVVAGAVADGRGLAASLALGAAGVQMGTRFIAASECAAAPGWKEAILQAGPDDVLSTERVSGVTANYLRTPELERLGASLGLPLQILLRSKRTARLTRKAMMALAATKMERIRRGERALWSAGHSASLVGAVQPLARILDELEREYHAAVARLPPPHPLH